VVTGHADPNANVIFGAVIDESMGDEVRVTVIATGFGGRPRRRRVEAPGATAPPASERRFETPTTSEPEIEIPSFLRED
jgi:cell division protein FtsZ